MEDQKARSQERNYWTTTYSKSFDTRHSDILFRPAPSPTPDLDSSPSKVQSRFALDYRQGSDSPVPKKTHRVQLAPLEGAYVLPGNLCQLDQMGMNQEVGRARVAKVSTRRPFLALATQDIEGASPKKSVRVSKPPKRYQRKLTQSQRPNSAFRNQRMSPEPLPEIRRESPTLVNPLSGLGLLEQLQVPKPPVKALRSRYLVIDGRGRPLRLYGHYEVSPKVGESLNASM